MIKLGSSIFAILLSACVPVFGQSYAMGPEDKIRVRVVEWTATSAQATNWDVLAGEYVVGADGNLVLPLIGLISVAGMTPESLAVRIGSDLEQRYGLLERISAAVEVIEYRPVYVLGGVASPGAFAYRPGLTVLQAVSLAGGLYRGGDLAIQFERDAITSAGDLQVLQLQRSRLLAREARLRTELAKGETVAMTDALREEGVGESVLADENALLQARRQSLSSQTEAISRLQELLEGELEAIQQKIDSENRLLTLSREELASVGNLVERGLAVSSRQREMVRVVAETESRLIDFQTLTLRARQEMSRAQRDLLQIQTQHHAGIVTELQETQAQIDENAARQTTARRVLNQVSRVSGATDGSGSLIYTIVRPGCPQGAIASADTPLRPSDTLQVSSDNAEPTSSAGINSDCLAQSKADLPSREMAHRTN
ncbi:polysaccharide biosynthesis/export family protein [Mesorhizobium sp. CAU 1741]|uniref:polysaccharide biosynthesis/export family protein n=1 Tax=Mesorhizobium sp. CAU 1741 TaxID=3140366 RepID=UPI00325B28A0